MITQSVLVIGAGAAGLAVAVELSRAGKRVTVLEGRNRIGGRIHTLRNVHSRIPIELGAEFVHGRAPEILNIVQLGKLSLVDVSELHWRFQNGKILGNASFFSDIEKIMKRMRHSKKDLSFRDFLVAAKVSCKIANRAMLYVQGFHAANPNRISIQGLNRYNDAAKQIEEDYEFRVIEGYQSIPQTLYEQAMSNGVAFHFNTIVRQIHWRKNSVVASGGLGKHVAEYAADAAVITVPLSVLQKKLIKFQPELPEKENAATRLVMGHVLKIIFLFRERFWEELKLPTMRRHESGFDLGFIHAPDEIIPTWWTQRSLRAPLLVGWTGGPNAEKLIKEDPEEILGRALAAIAKILGISRTKIEALLEDTYMHNWSADELSGGAYSYVPVGGLSAARDLAVPVMETIYFAGEAISERYIGTVHGAIASGQRAACEVMNR